MSDQNKYPFYLSTVIGAILIGLAPILMRYSEVSPSMTGFYRFFFAFLILLIYGAIKGKKFFVNINLYIVNTKYDCTTIGCNEETRESNGLGIE